MIYSTATVPVNPESEARLTRAQAWAGLELKARDARLFLPPGLCTRCDVIEESSTHLVREATIGGSELREIITLEPEQKVTFFQATGPREGAIFNELFEDANGVLQLRFYCYIGLRASNLAVRRSKPNRRNSIVTTATRLRCCRRSIEHANWSLRAGYDRTVSSFDDAPLERVFLRIVPTATSIPHLRSR